MILKLLIYLIPALLVRRISSDPKADFNADSSENSNIIDGEGDSEIEENMYEDNNFSVKRSHSIITNNLIQETIDMAILNHQQTEQDERKNTFTHNNSSLFFDNHHDITLNDINHSK